MDRSPPDHEPVADKGNTRRTRLQPEMRKQRIAQAAAEVFARSGFAATGFRDVAKASRTSEALVYRYFPTKQALWNAALEAVRNNAASQFILSPDTARPSTSRLIDLTVELALRFLSDAEAMQPQNRETLNRMLLRSLSEDASFARHMFSALNAGLSHHFQDCLKAARNSGDMETSDADDNLLTTLFFNLFFLVSSLQMHGLLLQGQDNLRLTVLDLVEFQLRGIGLRPSVVSQQMKRIRAMPLTPGKQLDDQQTGMQLPERHD